MNASSAARNAGMAGARFRGVWRAAGALPLRGPLQRPLRATATSLGAHQLSPGGLVTPRPIACAGLHSTPDTVKLLPAHRLDTVGHYTATELVTAGIDLRIVADRTPSVRQKSSAARIF